MHCIIYHRERLVFSFNIYISVNKDQNIHITPLVAATYSSEHPNYLIVSKSLSYYCTNQTNIRFIMARASFDVSRICIIGAGSSGLSFCKYLKAEDVFSTIDIYESMEEVGGAWNYTPLTSAGVSAPQTNPHVPIEEPILYHDHLVFPTPMYDTLRTNIPKDLMAYSDFQFPENAELFPSRQIVQQYLRDYSKEVIAHIKFSTQVMDVRLNTQASHETEKDKWKVSLRDLKSGIQTTTAYDAVVVANGHYTVPYVPPIEGLEAWARKYPGTVQHSKSYRSPEAYQGKKLVIVGNAASGADIGSQISKCCAQPLMWSIRTPTDAFGHDERLELPQIVEFLLENRAVKFENGRVEKNIDAVVFCTGYLYSFPFLQSISPHLVTDGKRVKGLYKQLFHIDHPTLVFALLPQKVLPFPMSEFQAAATARVWSQRIYLPNQEDMKAWEAHEVEQKGEGVGFHVLMPRDADYAQDMVDWMSSAQFGHGKSIAMWDEKFLWLRSHFAMIRQDYAKHIGVRTLEELGWDFEAHKREQEAGMRDI